MWCSRQIQLVVGGCAILLSLAALSKFAEAAPPTEAKPKNPAGQSAAANQAPAGSQVVATEEPGQEKVDIAPAQPFSSKDGQRKGWKLTIPGNHVLATPAVVAGKLFIGGGFGSHEFYAFDARSGKMLWQYGTADDGPTAAVATPNYVAFNTESCELEVLTLDGKLVWKHWLGDPLMSMPAIADDRLLMAFPDSKGDHQHHLACYELKTGKQHWRRPLAGEIISAPIIDDQQVFVATLEGSLYCFSLTDGRPLWADKEKSLTSSPTIWNGRCWFSRRQETTIAKAGKKVKQQMEQVAVRGVQSTSTIHDLAATQRVADYLDYSKRGMIMGGMGGGMGGMGFGSAKEAANQRADGAAGFDGGGVNADDPFASPPAPSIKPPKPKIAAALPPVIPPAGGGKGDAKIAQAQQNLGQGTVQGMWSYQGSKPFFYRDRLYTAMGDALVCLDPKTEKVVWKTELRTPQDKKKQTPKAEELLDAIVSPPAIVNGKLFVGTGHGDLVCLSADRGTLLWKVSLGPTESITFQPAVAEGRVYVSTDSGHLYCLETGDPQDDGWLMWGANAAHNGIVKREAR